MDMPNRRVALLGAGGIGLSAFLDSRSPVRAADPAKGDAEELFVVGPYDLGDWFARSKIEIDGLFNQGAPAREAIVKSLSACSVYVVDQRVRPAAGPLRYAKGDYPRVVLSGPYRHEWKDGKKEFVVQIAAAERNALSTDHAAPKPTRKLSVIVKLVSAGQTPLATTTSTTNFCVGPIGYNIDGCNV